MNPLDLPGPQFLAFYAVLYLAAVAVGALLRWFLRQPGDELPPTEFDLSPYEVAYLRGGEELAVNAAIARLVHQDVVAVDASSRKLKLHGEELPAGASQLERVVHAAVKGDAGETIAAVRSAVSPQLAPLKRRLQDLGLLVAGDQARIARFLPLAIVLLAPLLGVVKIIVGISRGRPVEILIVFCILSTIVAFLGFIRPVHRSRRGDRALVQLRTDNAAMEFQVGRRVEELSGDDLVLALGLFGMGILAGGPMADLQTALKPPSSSSGCGGGCGSSGCGGGCGGGGCGGCGG